MNAWLLVFIVLLSSVSFRSWGQTAVPGDPVFKPAEPAAGAPPANSPGPNTPLPPPPPAVQPTPVARTQPIAQIVDGAAPAIPYDENAKSRFVFELHTNGFFSSLRDGLFFGGGSRRFTGGVNIDIAQTNFGGNRKATSFVFGPSFRWAVADGLGDRVDMTVGANLALMKNMVTDNQGLVESDGYGLLAGVGPGLRYWMTKSLALTYSAVLVAELHLDRSREVVYITALQRMAGVEPTPRQSDVLYVYITGQLALTGYF